MFDQLGEIPDREGEDPTFTFAHLLVQFNLVLHRLVLCFHDGLQKFAQSFEAFGGCYC